jgi:hypothetical protein
MIRCVIVLYRTKVQDCVTINSLMQCDENVLNLIIVKNDGKFDLAEKMWLNSNVPNYKLIEIKHNMELSRVYNMVLKDIAGVVAIFDDDTYVKVMPRLIERDRADIILPEVYVNKRKLYPKRLWTNTYLRTHEITTATINTVMSGTIINLDRTRNKFTSKTLFDERINFYGVDTQFFLKAAEVKCTVYCHAKYHVSHQLAVNSVDRNSPFRRRSRRNALLVYFGSGQNFFRWLLGLRFALLCVCKGLKF